MMKQLSFFRLLGVILAFAGITSCTDDTILNETTEDQIVEGNKEEVSITAGAEELEEDTVDISLSTRTILRTGNVIIWGANDAINVWLDDSMQKFKTISGGERAVFQGLADALSSVDNAYALFPYDENATLSGSTITTKLNAEQTAHENSFDINSAVSVARFTASGQEAGGIFYNVCSFVRFAISSEYSGEKIVSATFSSNNGEALAGDLSIDLSNVEEPIGSVISNAQTSVTISAEGTFDGEFLNDGTSYVFIILPQTLQGFTLTLTSESGRTSSLVADMSFGFERSKVVNLGELNPTEWSKDYEDEGDHWVVYTAKGLYEWATKVNGGDFTTDKYGEGDVDLGLVLANDIDLNDYIYDGAWKPVCSQEHPYEGVIDGKEFAIKNMKIENREHPQYQGFLGWMREHSSVSNLDFESPVITSELKGTDDSERVDDSYVGVIAGAMNVIGGTETLDGATISNCHVTNGSVTGGEGVGGIVGRSFATRDVVENCTYAGTVNGIMFVGGIIGSNEGFVTNCHFNGTVMFDEERATGVGRIGGIVGSNNSAGVIGCTAQGTVSGGDERYVGGIVGVNNGPLYGCASSVTVNGENGGAIVGHIYGTMGASYAISGSANYGIVCWIQSNGIVDHCYTTLAIVPTSGNADLSSYQVTNISDNVSVMNTVLSESPTASGWRFVENDGSIVDSSVFPYIAKPQ